MLSTRNEQRVWNTKLEKYLAKGRELQFQWDTEKPEKNKTLRDQTLVQSPSELLTDGNSLRSSEKEHKADALALEADEGRDKLR